MKLLSILDKILIFGFTESKYKKLITHSLLFSNSGVKYPECLRWHGNKLYFSDMDGKKVYTIDMAGDLKEVVTLDKMCSVLGWLPDGSLLISSELLIR